MVRRSKRSRKQDGLLNNHIETLLLNNPFEASLGCGIISSREAEKGSTALTSFQEISLIKNYVVICCL